MTPPPPRVWTAPLALGLLTASGLLSALVSEHWGDAWSWFALGLPLAVMAWFALRRRTVPDASTDPEFLTREHR